MGLSLDYSCMYIASQYIFITVSFMYISCIFVPSPKSDWHTSLFSCWDTFSLLPTTLLNVNANWWICSMEECWRNIVSFSVWGFSLLVVVLRLGDNGGSAWLQIIQKRSVFVIRLTVALRLLLWHSQTTMHTARMQWAFYLMSNSFVHELTISHSILI